jgi:gliding motility-associated-like protein
MAAVIANQVDVNCHASNTGIINLNVVDGTMPYSYSWSGSGSAGPSATDLYVGAQQVTVTDALGCIVTLNTNLNEPPALYIDSMALDSMICSEASIVLGAIGAGGSTAYIYTWYENGVPISNNQYVQVDPVNSGTQYKLVLSEACGSPTDADSLIITFPTDIIPLATPVPYEACAPDTFLFLNTSTNGGEIASTVWVFSNGSNYTVPFQDSVKQEFVVAGMYDASMTVTSIYGCIYTNNFPQIISALQRPKAQFGMTTNPTTIFETTVGMIDKSINAVQWYWSAPAAEPAFSTSQNPVFNFPHEVDKYEVLLLVTNVKGCTDTVRGLLDVQNDFILYAPNTFTPDGDQHNQTWHVVTEGLDFNDFELEVYNRWGQIVWNSFDPNAEWDGTFDNKVIPQGIYNWKLRTKKVGTDEPLLFTGSVMIIR